MKLIYAILLILVIACQAGDKNKALANETSDIIKTGLIKGKELRFTLDATTISLSPTYQYFEDESGDPFLATLTPVENSLFINVFNFNTKKVDKKVEIQKEGPNAIPGVMNYAIIDSKRILIYSYPVLHTIIDFDGKILSQRNFLEIPYEASLFASKGAPKIWNSKLRKVTTLLTPELVNNADPNIPVLGLIDIESGDMEFFMSRSNMDNITHKTILSLVSYTFNPKQDLYASISQRGDKFHIQTVGEQERFINVPSAIRLPSLKVYGQPDISFEGSFKNDRFTQIVYDNWRSVYYLIKNSIQQKK
jgi:hypothetical protein